MNTKDVKSGLQFIAILVVISVLPSSGYIYHQRYDDAFILTGLILIVLALLLFLSHVVRKIRIRNREKFFASKRRRLELENQSLTEKIKSLR